VSLTCDRFVVVFTVKPMKISMICSNGMSLDDDSVIISAVISLIKSDTFLIKPDTKSPS
jgi:hypothetical protein